MERQVTLLALVLGIVALGAAGFSLWRAPAVSPIVVESGAPSAIAASGYEHNRIGPFTGEVAQNDCKESQEAVRPPPGGGKSGCYSVVDQGYFYVIYNPRAKETEEGEESSSTAQVSGSSSTQP